MIVPLEILWRFSVIKIIIVEHMLQVLSRYLKFQAPYIHIHTNMHAYLTEVDIQNSEDDGQRELGGVEGEEPLRGKHVSLDTIGLEMLV